MSSEDRWINVGESLPPPMHGTQQSSPCLVCMLWYYETASQSRLPAIASYSFRRNVWVNEDGEEVPNVISWKQIILP